MLNKELHEHIVKEYCASNRYSVTDELTASTIRCHLKSNVAIEPETRQEGYRKDNGKRVNMGRYDDEAEVNKT